MKCEICEKSMKLVGIKGLTMGIYQCTNLNCGHIKYKRTYVEKKNKKSMKKD